MDLKKTRFPDKTNEGDKIVLIIIQFFFAPPSIAICCWLST